jgi:hypothetical protein
MTYVAVTDWSELDGQQVLIRRGGETTDTGTVDAVTKDGSVLWLQGNGAVNRRLYAQAELYEAWKRASSK